MFLDPNKTKALVVLRSRTVNPLLGDLVLSVFSIHESPFLDSKLTIVENVRLACAWYCFSCFSENWHLRLVKHVFVGTSVRVTLLLYAFVLPVLEYCSPIWGSAAECHLQLLERKLGVFGGKALL